MALSYKEKLKRLSETESEERQIESRKEKLGKSEKEVLESGERRIKSLKENLGRSEKKVLKLRKENAEFRKRLLWLIKETESEERQRDCGWKIAKLQALRLVKLTKWIEENWYEIDKLQDENKSLQNHIEELKMKMRQS